ncbi:thioesterase family protein [Geitlerinema sp. PCC 7407]|uniref:acyl-CoA thioesterase n=1 Tax=Geitlerinema sp. PCC 7407 TaxID=1173025 RepID=UPI00029FFE27|nr:thioesterase family protein [Geitlerinema sp. PCC 7407]AFY68301.1 thioesterase superfamily protein [Geitlerinema sp. PCC 7407]
MQPFSTQLRVRHYELDTLGHVNNAVYQHYLEHAAIAHLEHHGFTLERYREYGGFFVMRRIALEYLRPALAGDTLEVTTWIQDMGRSRSTRCYEIRRLGQPDLLVTAEALWVWVDAQTARPRPIPDVFLQLFEQLCHAHASEAKG